MFKRLMLSAVVVGLAGCGSVPMFVDLGNEHIIRGKASGAVGGTVKFSATDARNSVTCEGSYPFKLSMVVNGTMQCSDGKVGTYIMNGEAGPAWRGEGEFSNGEKFRIFVNYTTDPDKR